MIRVLGGSLGRCATRLPAIPPEYKPPNPPTHSQVWSPARAECTQMPAIPLTKGYSALIDDEDAHLADVKWHAQVSRSGVVYAVRNAPREDGKQCSLSLHREVLALEPGDGQIVDHRNGNGLDCRRANLCIVTKQENGRNRGGAQPHGTSGFLGVTRQGSRWRAHIKVEGKSKYLGIFQTPEAANLARLKGELEIWGFQPRRLQAFQAAGLIREAEAS